mmetsp:Transcript_42274/g.108966  ORF Transcript_42274/g.108966 Transcript_42274/m.108966 type:complete len:286 (+) Transcript_42274:1242-2099(+)
MHGHAVEILGPLLAARRLDVEQLSVVLLDVDGLGHAQQLHGPGAARIRWQQALGVEVHGLLRHLELSLLTHLHLQHRGRPHRRCLWVAQGEDHGGLLLLGISLLILDGLDANEGQMSRRVLALDELGLPHLIAWLNGLFLHHIAFCQDRSHHILLHHLGFWRLLLPDHRLRRGLGLCLFYDLLRRALPGDRKDDVAILQVVGLGHQRLDVIQLAAIASELDELRRHPEAVLQVLLQHARGRIRLDRDGHLARGQRNLQLHRCRRTGCRGAGGAVCRCGWGCGPCA